MRSALVIACASLAAAAAHAQIDLRGPEPRVFELADALELETAGEMIVSTPSEAPCGPERASRWRAVCVEIRGDTLYILVRAADGRTRDAALARTATTRTLAVIAASLLAELALPGAAPAAIPAQYADTERPPGLRPRLPAPVDDDNWRAIGQVGLAVALLTSGQSSALGPALLLGMGVETPFGLRVLASIDGTYPIAIVDTADLWLVRGGLSVGARIDWGPAAFHVLARGSAGFTPQRYGDLSRYSVVPLASGGAAAGVSVPLTGTEVVILFGLDVMQRAIHGRPLELLSSLSLVSEFR